MDSSTELPVHADFLRRVARRSNRKVRTKIFTTNYDKCFEQAGSAGRFVVIDGFSHMLPQTFDASYFGYDIVQRDEHTDSPDYISNVFHLYKMHGSVDWTRHPETKEISKTETPENPVLIYPRHTKYELAFEQPYLEMMSAFQAAIRKPNTGLIVVGFGFNDNHISEPILAAMRSNLNLKVVVCDPVLAPEKARSEGEKDWDGIAKTNQYLKKVQSLIENGDPRLALLNGTFEDLVSVMPDILAETALEKHLERVKRMAEAS
ncbi:SIR2 family protein [Endozoicomonas numazuensis]|uniref:SIR2 family protein n=1 Tax=Endozoicomonas numazuensis TaxID=1137799 RepID=UPI001377F9DE|nr:SIR2 family protein [Endozoicomonas numazuensis]